MRDLIINKILNFNDKHNKLDFGATRPLQKYLLSYATDEALLLTYETLIRFDEEVAIKNFINTGIQTLI